MKESSDCGYDAAGPQDQGRRRRRRRLENTSQLLSGSGDWYKALP